jgi:hypothetical protein
MVMVCRNCIFAHMETNKLVWYFSDFSIIFYEFSKMLDQFKINSKIYLHRGP